MPVEHELLAAFTSRKKTLALAESCTGGAIAARLTSVSGASEYFLGSIVAYSNEFKRDFLGVSEELLERHGAVSAEVVVAMVEGLLAKTRADIAASVSGIAGPNGATPGKPVGTVWVAVVSRGSAPIVQKLQLSGSRSAIIDASASAVLQLIYTTIA
jgi:PncC family amidohydrolase